jgi:hypothetical protein
MTSDSLPPRADLETAYHEAAHAVVAVRERLRVYGVTIEAGSGYDGQVRYHFFSPTRQEDIELDAWTARDRRRMEAMARVAFAGFAAQRRMNPQADPADAGADERRALRVVERFTASDREVEAYLALLRVQAEDYLDRPLVWDQVIAVAEALVIETTIRPARLRAIMREAAASALDALAQAHQARVQAQARLGSIQTPPPTEEERGAS